MVAGVKRPRARSTSRVGRGDGGLARVQVAQIQRSRILAAMFELASEKGVANVSVADVVKRSGVSRRTFYEIFVDREDCFLAAFDDALGFISSRVAEAYLGQSRWCDQIRAGLVVFLSFLDEEPAIARLLIWESSVAGYKTRQRREQVLGWVAVAIDEGRKESNSTVSAQPLTAEGLVGGVLAILGARIAHSEDEPLLGLTGVLMSMIVLPYRGSVAARRELERPVEPLGEGRSMVRLREDPFKSQGMRLTYRTVHVLLTLAEHPGASNRLIGKTADIADQGQISKLLSRLGRLGLIENTGLGPGQGAPNAWVLTDTGRQLTNSFSALTTSSP